MLPAIHAELLKLTTVRTTRVFLLGTAGAVLLAVLFQATTAGGEFLAPLDDPGTQHTLLTAGGLAPMVAIVLGTLEISGEFRHRTVVPTLLVTPNRGRVVAAKVVGALVGGLAVGLAAVVAAAVATTGVLAATGTGLETELGRAAASWAGTLVAAALGALLGLGIGGLARNQALAVGAALIVLLAIEPLVASMLPDVGAWLPARLTTAIAEPAGVAHPTAPVAALVLAAYGLVTTAIAAVTFARVDVS